MLEYTKRKEEENSYKSSMHGVESVRVKAQKRVIEERTTKLSNLMQKRTEFYQIAGNLGQVVSPTKLIGGKKQVPMTAFSAQVPISYFQPVDSKYTNRKEKEFGSSQITMLQTPSVSQLARVGGEKSSQRVTSTLDVVSKNPFKIRGGFRRQSLQTAQGGDNIERKIAIAEKLGKLSYKEKIQQIRSLSVS